MSPSLPKVVVFLLCFVLVIEITPRTAAAACPNPGEREATESDIPLMRAVGFPADYAKVGNCWKPTDNIVGAEAGEAKQYLRTIVCTGSQFGGTTPDETVNKLDARFAVCAAKFLKAMSSQLPGGVPLLSGGTNPVCLREGFRTVAQQEKYAQEYRNGGGIACTKGAACEHPRGIAIDVNTQTDSNYQKMWDLGSQYGVNFYLRARDKVHFVPAKTDCSSGGINPGNLDHQQTTFPGESTVRRILQPSFSAPTQSTAPATTQSNTSSTQGTSASNADSQTSPSTGTCSPQFYCTNSTYYYRTSTCVDQVYQKCQWGCASNGLCATATSSTSTTQTTGGGATSTYDLIGGYANLTQATTTPAPKEIPINPETAQATVLVPQQTPQGIVYVTASGQGHATQTFTSSDLSGSLPSLTQPASGFQATLNAVKQTVVALLRYLRPFGGAAQTREYAD